MWWGDGDNTFIFTLTYSNALVDLHTAVTYFSHITHFFHPKYFNSKICSANLWSYTGNELLKATTDNQEPDVDISPHYA